MYDPLNMPKYFYFDNHEWTIENRLLTISSKSNRQNLNKHYDS